MKIVAAAALASLAMAWTPTQAADLFGTAAPPIADAPQVEVGTNWYIRGDLGIAQDQQPSLSPTGVGLPSLIPAGTLVNGQSGFYPLNQNDMPAGFPSTSISAPYGPGMTSRQTSIDLGGGYKFNDWFRVDGTFEYRTGPGASLNTTVVCPAVATALSNTYGTPTTVAGVTTWAYATTPIGYSYDQALCVGALNATTRSATTLINGYVDLGTYWNVTPYVGASVGENIDFISGTVQYTNQSNGQTYTGIAVSGTAPNIYVYQTNAPLIINNNFTPTYKALPIQPHVYLGSQTWNRTISTTKYTIAVGLTAGFGVALSPSATLDVSYRYLDTGKVNGQDTSSQQLRVGVRYMLN